MQRFAILMSPNGYEISVGLIDDPDAAKSAISNVTKQPYFDYYVKIVWCFEHNEDPRHAPDHQLKKRATALYQQGVADYGARINDGGNGISLGNQMMYNIRKNHAHVDGQKEFYFALNQNDIDWIYQRSPHRAGLIICQLFDGTKSGDHVMKEIEDPRTGKMRRISGFNQNTPKEWDKRLEYDLEDFHDIYKAKEKSYKRRDTRK